MLLKTRHILILPLLITLGSCSQPEIPLDNKEKIKPANYKNTQPNLTQKPELFSDVVENESINRPNVYPKINVLNVKDQPQNLFTNPIIESDSNNPNILF